VPATPEPLSFITAFQSARQYILEQHGESGWARVRDTMRERHDIALPPEFESGIWLPTQWFVSTLNVARELFGPPDFHAKFGAAAAEYEVSWMHRVALRFTSPQWLLERGAEYWSRSHSTGRWEVVGRKGWMRGTLHDFGVVDAGYCDSLRAWVLRACLMTGASRSFLAERTCRARGGDVCVFEGTW
jgi:hypothetical protein